mmetsp:Transcript_5068/g.11256  ORF Transcript_5068/g.11256 Transcript_5068/m.11256 type:complete len:313 (+) Transcript_5068:72-1010(+)
MGRQRRVRLSSLLGFMAAVRASPQRLQLLNEVSLGRLSKLLSSDEFRFLGSWRLNVTFLQHLNARLVNGSFAVIDGFFSADVAKAVFQDTLRGAEAGWFRGKGMALNATGVDVDSYFAAASPAARCAMLDAVDERIGFKFSFQALDPRGQATPRASDFPGHVAVFSGLLSKRWTEALLLLLTGSSAQSAAAEFEMPYFREFRTADYTLLHNDMGGDTRRALCLNYWIPSQRWKRSWGGNFLWCGSRDRTKHFPDAVRLRPLFNQANVFVPHSTSWHAVDAVEAPLGSARHRFSFTSWLNVPLEGRERGVGEL